MKKCLNIIHNHKVQNAYMTVADASTTKVKFSNQTAPTGSNLK